MLAQMAIAGKSQILCLIFITTRFDQASRESIDGRKDGRSSLHAAQSLSAKKRRWNCKDSQENFGYDGVTECDASNVIASTKAALLHRKPRTPVDREE
jgi:hypothetical protein